VSDVTDLLETMRSKNADVLVGATFYTSERDKVYDFSYPILAAGLQVLVRGTGENGTPTPLRDVMALLFSKSAAIWLGVALIIILVPAHVIWLLDRGREDSVSPGKGYFPGILDALVWATTALVSQVQLLPNQWLARVFGLLWMFAGVVFISLYTAELTATLTVEQIRGAINGPEDLPGKRVAVLANSVAADYLRKIGAQVQAYQTGDEVFAALLSQKADAALGSAPGVRYYAAHAGRGRVSVVGPEIDRQDMGFLFQLGSPLRKQVGNALIALHEDGTYQRIYEKWLGED
jgi:polar amino acid transport system substrate-binding protein